MLDLFRNTEERVFRYMAHLVMIKGLILHISPLKDNLQHADRRKAWARVVQDDKDTDS